MTRKKQILFDGDMLVYVVLLSCEQEILWYNNLYTVHIDLNEACNLFDKHMHELTELVLEHYKVTGAYKVIVALSDMERNFRKEQIDSEYKANRKNKKRPLAYVPMREWIVENYNTIMIPTLEADDTIGVTADKGDIVVSGDKDFRTIPYIHLYDFCRNEFVENTIQEATYFHYYQTLVGDTVDGYKGAKGIGDVKARQILQNECTWSAVVRAFKASGQDEQDALRNARLAYILRKENYNKKTKEITLWTPKENQVCIIK